MPDEDIWDEEEMYMRVLHRLHAEASGFITVNY